MSTSTTYPATPKQLSFLKSLVAERPVWAAGVGLDEEMIERLSKKNASGWIDRALKVARETPKPAAKPRVTEAGMYRNPSTGELFRVQPGKYNPGKLYAKRMVKIEGWTFETHGKKTHTFVYEPGLIREIDPAWRMTLEEAKAWGVEFGSCCVCGAFLTNPESVALGIGPVCGGRV